MMDEGAVHGETAAVLERVAGLEKELAAKDLEFDRMATAVRSFLPLEDQSLPIVVMVEKAAQLLRSYKDLDQMAWGIIANANEGDWTKATKEWQEAAHNWRNAWLALP